jgi:hypothetical protein
VEFATGIVSIDVRSLFSLWRAAVGKGGCTPSKAKPDSLGKPNTKINFTGIQGIKGITPLHLKTKPFIYRDGGDEGDKS